MTQLSYRASAASSVAEARRRRAENPIGDARIAARDRMIVDTAEAVLLGMGELLDLDVGRGTIGLGVAEAVGAALASFLMTACAGDTVTAKALIPGALAEIRDFTLRRLDMPASKVVYGEAVAQTRGRA